MVSQRIFTAEEARRVGDGSGSTGPRWTWSSSGWGSRSNWSTACDVVTNVTNDDLVLTGKIALAHLLELPDYYTRLMRMEKKHG